jgi:riboflavin transporter FmnP
MTNLKLQTEQVQNRKAFIKGFKTGLEISAVTLLILNTILINPAFGSQQEQQDSSKISNSKMKIVSLALWIKAVLKKKVIQIKKKAYVLGLIVGVLVSWWAVRKINHYWYCLKKFLSFCSDWLYPHYYIPGEDFTEYLELPSAYS